VRVAKAKTAKGKATPAKATGKARPGPRPIRWLKRWVWRGLFAAVVFVAMMVGLYALVPPPTTIYMWQEKQRLGSIEQIWVAADDVAPVMLRSVVAAEDANYCTHWGFDVTALRAAIEGGGQRGGSTISQQVVKNVYLWHGRTYLRKALEALITPAVEAAWSKRRIVEVYLNVAEFDEGVFGIGAASQHYFGLRPSQLNATQAARLAAILPAPKSRSASNPSNFVRRRAAQIRDGAATIQRDGRADCFE